MFDCSPAPARSAAAIIEIGQDNARPDFGRADHGA